MSFELFPQENANVLASFGATQRRDPGVFDNFFPSAGNAIMRGFAETGRAVSMLGAVGPMLQDTDKYGQRGTEAVDKYFKRHDEIWNRAVESWTPKRSEVGVAGEVVGQLLGTIPLLIASPAALIAKTQMSVGEDLVRKGVDADKAGAVGAVQAAGLGLGVWLPVLGKTLAQRVVIGGAGFNAVQGVATRGVSGAILEGTKAADEFQAFDPASVTLDVLLGLAFGGLAHLSPAQRAQGEAAWSRIAEWTGTFKPSDIDALVTLKQAEHLNVESAPGRMATAEDIAKHHAAMKQAVDDLLNDRPVDVGMLTEGAKFLPDDQRIAFGKTIADELNAQAKGMVEADMLAQLARMEAEAKPGFIRSAEELLALKQAAEQPVLHPDLERAIEISRRPGFLRTAEEKLTLDAVLQGRAQDVIGLPDGMKAGPEGSGQVHSSSENTIPSGGKIRDSAEADPLRSAAEQFAAERPDLTLTIGADQDGQPITISAAKYLEDARLDTELAAQDAGLFEVAASCMLRG